MMYLTAFEHIADGRVHYEHTYSKPAKRIGEETRYFHGDNVDKFFRRTFAVRVKLKPDNPANHYSVR